MTGVESPGSAWWREELRRRTDPTERTADREGLRRRLFGTDPDTEDKPADGPNDGPNAA